MRLVISLSIVIAISTAPSFAQTTTSTQAPAATTPAPAPSKDAAPEHLHTGWATLLGDTAGDFVTFPKRKSTWVILGAGAAAALLAHLEDEYVEEHALGNSTANNMFSVGQWLGSTYVQVGSAVGLWAVGRYVVAPVSDEPKTNKYSEVGFDLIRAQAVAQGIAQGMKHAVRRERPTGECCSFPSGHAAAAFAAASVLERHLGYRGSWPALAGATYVATSRLVDNRHFLSDVVMGAAIGMASGWTVVGRQRGHAIVMQPVPTRGGVMMAFTRAGAG